MRGAIFDMDGLLLDTERIYQQTWREMAAEYGVALDGRFTADIIGISRAGSLAVIARYLPMVDPDAFVTEGSRRVYEKEAAGIPLMPGVRTILEGLRGLGCGLAVASSSGTERRMVESRTCRTPGWTRTSTRSSADRMCSGASPRRTSSCTRRSASASTRRSAMYLRTASTAFARDMPRGAGPS